MFATAKAAPLALASTEDATSEYVGGRQQWAVSDFLFFVCKKYDLMILLCYLVLTNKMSGMG